MDRLPKDQVEAAYAEIPAYEYDLDAAKKELAQSAYPDGATIVAETISTYPSFVRTTEILKEAAAKIGITIDIKGVPGAQWLTDSTDHKIELTVSTFSSLSPDPNFYPDTLMRADGVGAGGSNYADLEAPGLADAISAASAAPAQSEEQLKAVVAALKANADQVGYIPVYTQKAVFAHDAKISFDDFSQYSMGTPYPLFIK
ncbi:ABC transporter substrate-binding protein [Aeromicrobium sp. UC242_57]|uniref:ABC transporter substrate-binding protein n=1 Tax=Aeromicrobium sp. UC242_57 TaxID=3374624 RepID=UPI0037B6294F